MKKLPNIFTKKAAVLAMCAVTLMTFTSCKDSDIVAGVIVGGVVGGIVAGGGVSVGVGPAPYTYRFLSDCEGYRREWVCEWSSYNGGWYRSYRRHPRWNDSLFESTQTQADLKAQAIAEKWGLKPQSAQKLSQAIEAAKGGEMKAFNKIGLSLKDLHTLISKNQIDVNDLDRVASALKTEPETALAILNSFTAEYRSQEKDVNSALWNQCISKGAWKTPQVAACSSLDAEGCAPALGATSCLPL